ncbi:MAG: low-specificity L-threonine aldolase [Candidatus Marinimicrobia bacterium]|nr:low-specificity L-threonine aldolase [Candidatus Neomarinimicrobiota bacterium]|tara:strand:+ start:1585 stop:2622 length:1038 start_codon:yes stop_codon:yes gene_type:complete
MKQIDLRSDTVTLPSKEMKESILNSQLGDDVFQEDHDVNLLEKKAAKLSGKNAALLVPSGTMGNLISFLAHCPRGTEAILGDKSHTFTYEAGGISAFGGIHSHQLKNEYDGTIDIDSIKNAIRTDNIHFPKTSLISLENTHNKCFGYPLSKNYIDQVSNIAKENNIKLHVDGARIFNATVALNTSLEQLIKNVDSITFCLSKGLACPIGSLICGSNDFINDARRIRKALGGGMRQAGIIASAGLHVIDNIDFQILEDHQNAKMLADGINSIKGLKIDASKVKSNIIYCRLESSIMSEDEFLNKCEEYGVLFFKYISGDYRLVTHYGITKEDIDYTLNIFKKVLSK